MDQYSGKSERVDHNAPASPEQIQSLVDLSDQLVPLAWETYETDSIIMGKIGGVQLVESFDDANGTIIHHYYFDIVPTNFGNDFDQENDEILSIEFSPSGIGYIQPDKVGYDDEDDEDDDAEERYEYPPRETVELARNICIDLLLDVDKEGKPKLNEFEQALTYKAISVMAGYLEQVDFDKDQQVEVAGEKFDIFTAIGRAISSRTGELLVTREYVHVDEEDDTKLTVSRYYKTDEFKYFHLPDLEIELIDDEYDRVTAMDYNDSGHALVKYYDSSEDYEYDEDDENEDTYLKDDNVTPRVGHFLHLQRGLEAAVQHELDSEERYEQAAKYIEHFRSDLYPEYVDLIEQRMTTYCQEDEDPTIREACRIEATEAFEELKEQLEANAHLTPGSFNDNNSATRALNRLSGLQIFKRAYANTDDDPESVALEQVHPLKRGSLPRNGLILAIYHPQGASLSVEKIHFIYDNLELREEMGDDGKEFGAVYMTGYKLNSPLDFEPVSYRLRYTDIEAWASSNN